VVKNANPVPFDAEKATWDYAIYPTTPAYFMYQGYGIVDRGAKERALRVLLGTDPMPVRTDVDTWIAQVDAVRNQVYGAP
ncbi:MAG TPA: hypothetical protein VGB28_05740, partial [Actinomycetota bacterium]